MRGHLFKLHVIQFTSSEMRCYTRFTLTTASYGGGVFGWGINGDGRY